FACNRRPVTAIVPGKCLRRICPAVHAIALHLAGSPHSDKVDKVGACALAALPPGAALGGRSDRSPAFGNLAALKTPEHESMYLHLSARCVCPPPNIAADHFVAFRYHLFDRYV